MHIVNRWYGDSGARDAVLGLAQCLERTVYVVGGSVRDRLLGRDGHDMDFAVDHSAMEFARQVARELRGALVTLDEERDTSRVVIFYRGDRYYLDFARMQGRGIRSDLRRRDFTMNALGIPLAEWCCGDPEIVDPCGGVADIGSRLLRVTHPLALQDDPARVIRAVRFVGQLGLTVDSHTEALVRQDAGLLSTVSGERVRDELSLILALEGAYEQVDAMSRWGVLTVVFPELIPLRGLEQTKRHQWDAYNHSLRTVAGVDALFHVNWFRALTGEMPESERLLQNALSPYRDRLVTHLQEVLSADRTRTTLIRLIALLHDIGKRPAVAEGPECGAYFRRHSESGALLMRPVLRRLCFSNRESHMAQTMVRHHMLPGRLGRYSKVARDAAYRYFRDTGDVGLDVLLLSLADHLATRGPALDLPRWQSHLDAVRSLLDTYFTEPEVVNPPKLVDGGLLVREIEGLRGRAIGVLLEEIREAQATGAVRTEEEALAHAKRAYAALSEAESQSHTTPL